MNTRTFAVGLLCYVCLGCRIPDGPPSDPSVPASSLLEDEKPEPVADKQPVQKQEPAEEDHLSQGADCIAKGDDRGALVHLKAHLIQHPDHLMIRIHLAELLFKTQQFPAAQWNYEQFIADAQAVQGTPRNKLMHCHTRLMEIALVRQDDHAEHLHRGIGFVLVARQLDAGVPEPEEGFRERVLCKALRELQAARDAQPDQARAYCYLHEAFRKLDQPRPAERAREKAKSLAAFSNLTPTEKQSLIE